MSNKGGSIAGSVGIFLISAAILCDDGCVMVVFYIVKSRFLGGCLVGGRTNGHKTTRILGAVLYEMISTFHLCTHSYTICIVAW